jgi:hypothetical protein
VSAGLPSYTSVRSRETDSFEVFVQLFKQLLSATYTKSVMYVPFGNDVCLLGEKVPFFILSSHNMYMSGHRYIHQ